MQFKKNTSIYFASKRASEIPNAPTEGEINRGNKEWNFGLTEYADTVGPQGEWFEVQINETTV